MKRHLRLVALVLLTPFFIGLSSCSEEPTGRSSFFRPPGWIQGTWKDDAGTSISFTFTTNNFVQNAPDHFDFNSMLKAADGAGEKADVEETSTLDNYRAVIYERDTVYNFNFVKVAAKQIRWTNPKAPHPQVTMTLQ